MTEIKLVLIILYAVCFFASLWFISCFTQIIDIIKATLFSAFVLFVITCILLSAVSEV